MSNNTLSRSLFAPRKMPLVCENENLSPDLRRNVFAPAPQLRERTHVAILLCTYNGQRFLAEQLQSFTAQRHANWKLWVSDDRSTDGTQDILEKYREQWGDERLSIHVGPGRGFTANFLSLICNPSIRADYYAYADQDDVWEEDKFERAMAWLDEVPADLPALYCSRTRLIDENDKDLGFSPLFTRAPSFANALVQNIGGGNTMVFNDAARRLLCEAGADIRVPAHDWWTYMVIAGCGGKIFYDPHPATRYRQHGQNLYGSNMNWHARMRRAKLLLDGHFRAWNEQNVEALRKIRAHLTPANRQILEKFSSAREQGVLGRVVGIRKSRVYRQTLSGNLGLAAAAALNKI